MNPHDEGRAIRSDRLHMVQKGVVHASDPESLDHRYLILPLAGGGQDSDLQPDVATAEQPGGSPIKRPMVPAGCLWMAVMSRKSRSGERDFFSGASKPKHLRKLPVRESFRGAQGRNPQQLFQCQVATLFCTVAKPPRSTMGTSWTKRQNGSFTSSS